MQSLGWNVTKRDLSRVFKNQKDSESNYRTKVVKTVKQTDAHHYHNSDD